MTVATLYKFSSEQRPTKLLQRSDETKLSTRDYIFC